MQEKETKQVNVELEDKTYRLMEMSDSMKQAIDNNAKVLASQNSLIELVLASKKANAFRDFVKDTEQYIDQAAKQNAVLAQRVGLLDKVIEKCKENEENAKLVTMLVEALGVFSN